MYHSRLTRWSCCCNRFYEHYDGAREKEKCFLVGISTKSRRKMAEEGTAASAKAELLAGSPYGSSSRQSDEDSDDESSDDEWANEVSGRHRLSLAT